MKELVFVKLDISVCSSSGYKLIKGREVFDIECIKIEAKLQNMF